MLTKTEIRLFYVNTSNILSEYAYTANGWGAGKLQQQNITLTSNSLAACMITDSNIRLYYIPTPEDATGPIIELAGDGTNWNQTSAVITTQWRLRDTGGPLSAVGWRGTTNHVRIYYVNEYAQTAEMVFEESNGWQKSKFAIPSLIIYLY
jgi:hypothetical protein